MDRIRYAMGVVTLLVVCVAGWWLASLIQDEDKSGQHRLLVEFNDARSLKVGADVRYRGVRVGSVRLVDLSPDGRKGVISLSLDVGRESLACNSSVFWIVTPRFEGLATGASGLDTLVRDAYVAFRTPEPAGPVLPSGSILQGQEVPAPGFEDTRLPPRRHGDLLMVLLVPESHDLRIGAAVRFRGIDVGEVRSIDLADGGGHVEVRLRIAQRYRGTVTEESRFWIARPRLSGALLSGLAVEDLGALLRPYVGYHGDAGGALPVPDGYRVIVSGARPEIDEEIGEEALAAAAGAVPEVEGESGLQVVEVLYAAREIDWFSPNDEIKRRGLGVLYVDRSGRVVVLTCRSVCDAGYTERDSFGTSADIEAESIRVVIPRGSVLRAGRHWVDPGGADLALLVVEDAPVDLRPSPATVLDFETSAEPADAFQRLDGERLPGDTPLERIGELLGTLALRGDRAFALVGRRQATGSAVMVVPLAGVPEELRPGQ